MALGCIAEKRRDAATEYSEVVEDSSDHCLIASDFALSDQPATLGSVVQCGVTFATTLIMSVSLALTQ